MLILNVLGASPIGSGCAGLRFLAERLSAPYHP